MNSRKPFGYFVKRGPDDDTLDRSLARQAERAGVKIICSSKMDKDKVDIIATGGRAVAGVTKEVVFETNINNTFRVIFDNGITPEGFSYLFVIDSKATVGCAILKSFSQINNIMKWAIERFREIEKFEINNPKETVSYVDFYLPKSAKFKNKLLIGEAGGFQDYLFGLGIRISITSGFLAAKSIVENMDYDKLWKSELASKMKMSIVNRFLYEIGGNKSLALFNRRAQKVDFKEFGYDLYRPRLIKKILFPLITLMWKNYSGCVHGESCLWCRRKSGK